MSGLVRATSDRTSTDRSDLAILRRVRTETRGSGRWLLLALFLDLLATPLALLSPVPLAIAVDSAIGDKPLPTIFGWLIPGGSPRTSTSILILAASTQIAVVFISELLSLASSYLKSWVGERITLDVRSRMLASAQQLSFRFHDRVGTADSVYRIQYDAPAIQAIGTYGLLPIATAVFTLFSMVFVMFRIDHLLAVISIAVAPVLVLLSTTYRTTVKPQYKVVKRLESGSLWIVQEIFSAFRVVKAFGMERSEEERFQIQSETALRARLKVSRSEGVYSLLLNMATAVGTASILVIGGLRVGDGRITLGALLLVLSYLGQLFGPLQTISKLPVKLQSQIVSADRAIELLDERPEVQDRIDGISVDRVHGDFTLRDVSFTYEPGLPVLSEVNLEIPSGTKVGVIGRTGAGKSTLASLLIRFYDVGGGAILLDGIDVREYRLSDLRKQFTMVLQDPFLFSTSIGENIAFGRPSASSEEIEVAARAAGIHDFVAQLPDGYETVVGERGMRLSGGERQRISLARAFLKDSPILLLDEPTSSVDVQTEEAIMDSMERLMAGRTTFMIAHRLSTISSCDMVVEIEDGRLSVVRTRGTVRCSTGNGVDAERPEKPTPVEAPDVEAEAHLIAASAFPGFSVMSSHAYPTARRNKTTAFFVRDDDYAISLAVKRQRPEPAVIERHVYNRILSVVGVQHLRCHGVWRSQVTDWAWLVTDHASGSQFDPNCPEHAARLGRWLGTTHVRAAATATTRALPTHDAPYCRNRLSDAISVLDDGAANIALSPESVACLLSLRTIMDEVLSRWDDMTALLAATPPTLVHGDLTPSNVKMFAHRDGLRPLVFDWETAGFGSPMVDLPNIDLVAYRDAVSSTWPNVDLGTLRRLQTLGVVAWTAYVLLGERSNLESPWPERAAAKVPAYLGRIERAHLDELLDPGLIG